METLKGILRKIPKNVLTTVFLLAVGAAFLGVYYVPQKAEERRLSQFAQPLFYHLLPEDTYAVQTSSVRDDDGGTTAAIIIGTSLSSDELIEFYSDAEYLPANEGETVTLEVKALDESSISALKQAGKYREQSDYYFLYIYSRP